MNDTQMMMSFLEDFSKVNFNKITKKDLLKKYNITKSQYEKYRRRFVTEYDVDPVVLYNREEIISDAELKSLCKDETIKKTMPQIMNEFSKLAKEKEASLTLKGTSTLYDADGNVKMQWVKTDLNKEKYLEAVRSSIKTLCETLPESKHNELKQIHKQTLKKDQMVFIPIPDLHFGLKIERERVDHDFDWDMDIAEKYFKNGMSYLINTAPSAKQLVIADLGDLLHSPSNENRTPKHKHVLDVCGSYEHSMLRCFELLIDTIKYGLEKYEEVYFYSVPGNHNIDISLTLKYVLKQHFRNEPRAHIDVSKYNNIYYHKFGKNLLSFTHGDEIHANKIESVIFADNLKDVSNFKYFDAYFGHLHQNKQQSYGMINCRTTKNIIPCDKWASSMGYRNKDVGYMQAFVYHNENGELSNISYRPSIDQA